jgi:hypothetical protein
MKIFLNSDPSWEVCVWEVVTNRRRNSNSYISINDTYRGREKEGVGRIKRRKKRSGKTDSIDKREREDRRRERGGGEMSGIQEKEA